MRVPAHEFLISVTSKGPLTLAVRVSLGTPRLTCHCLGKLVGGLRKLRKKVPSWTKLVISHTMQFNFVLIPDFVKMSKILLKWEDNVIFNIFFNSCPFSLIFGLRVDFDENFRWIYKNLPNHLKNHEYLMKVTIMHIQTNGLIGLKWTFSGYSRVIYR